MKKKLFVIIVLAACILVLCRQPEFNEINVGNIDYKVVFKNNMLYSVSNFKYMKLIDEKILDFKLYDIDYDGNDEILIITEPENKSKYGAYVVIYDTTIKNEAIYATEMYRKDFSQIKPWKIDACNLDNDMDADIFIGVNKDTVFYKDVRNRPFFYSWDGEKLYKKWLGSFFTDWDFVDIAFGDYFNLGHDTAAVLEKNENDEFRVGVYNFTGFGFLNIAQSYTYSDTVNLKTVRDNNSENIVLKCSFLGRNFKVTFDD